MHREYRQKQISQQNVMQQSRGKEKKSPIKNLGPSDKRDKIVEVTRESYSEYSEA